VTGISALPPAKLAAHEAAVARLRDAYAAVPPGVPVRLAKPTSNLFRFRDSAQPGQPGHQDQPGHQGHQGQPRGERGEGVRAVLDVSAFARVIHVDPATRTAVVGGMTTYEDLCDATLPHGLMPLVVPQLKTITLGGAVTGLGIESTSLWHGLPHESVIEMQILTGDGRVIVATKDNEYSDLYYGFPNSYGTLGYSLALTIELMPVKPYVHVRHHRFTDPASCMAAIAEVARDGSYQGQAADFLDGVAFGPDELYLTVGAFSDKAPWLSDYTGQQVYYKSVRASREDFLTVKDYIWRWDTDWFWCSRAFGVQQPVIRRLWPRKYRRSDVYRKIVAFDQKYGRGDPGRARPRLPRLVREERGDDPRLALPDPAARRADLDAVPDAAGRGLRQLRFLGYLRPARGQGRRLLQPDGGGGGHRAPRAQVAVLHRLLFGRGIPRALQRRGLRQAQGRVRRERQAPRSLRQVRAAPLTAGGFRTKRQAATGGAARAKHSSKEVKKHSSKEAQQ